MGFILVYFQTLEIKHLTCVFCLEFSVVVKVKPEVELEFPKIVSFIDPLMIDLLKS